MRHQTHPVSLALRRPPDKPEAYPSLKDERSPALQSGQLPSSFHSIASRRLARDDHLASSYLIVRRLSKKEFLEQIEKMASENRDSTFKKRTRDGKRATLPQRRLKSRRFLSTTRGPGRWNKGQKRAKGNKKGRKKKKKRNAKSWRTFRTNKGAKES